MDMIKKAKYILICLLAVLCLAVICGCSAGTEEAEEQAPADAPAAEEAEFSDLTEFTAVTADGEKITQDYFRDYDATIINIWATYCPPCIEEMPKLAELEKNRPETLVCCSYARMRSAIRIRCRSFSMNQGMRGSI